MKKESNKNSKVILATLAVVLCAGAIGVVTLGNKDTNNTNDNTSTAQVLNEGDNLVIPLNEVTDKASFYSVEVEGTPMEVLAIKDAEGNVRTAFNTCQVCYGSGRGYYKQEGDNIVCQNCGNAFTAEQVEMEVGGCNPVPIFDEDKTVTNDSITISYDFLDKYRQIFENWKIW